MPDFNRVRDLTPGSGGDPESVWDYPRPPRVERSGRRICVFLNGRMLADTTSSRRVLERSHPPVYYIPLADVLAGALEPSGGRGSYCEWKGAAIYYDVIGGEGRRVERAAWGYPKPSAGFEDLVACVAFYPGLMDECTVDGERVSAQAGDFYGGWITGDVLGPFKGGPGTRGW
jgi:uncharacterized protein (DUF427 family)